MTVEDIITRALKLTGIQSSYEDLDSNDAADALAELNGILDHWNIDKLRGYNQETQEFTLVPGQETYTIGAGGDFNGTRPVRIEFMYVRDNISDNIDYTVSSVSFAEYNSIKLKDIQSYYPQWYYYNPEYPLGEINFYPVPSKAYTLYMTQWYKWGAYTATSDVVDLPEGYTQLLVYNLACNMCSYFGKPTPPEVYRRFSELEYSMNSLNSQQWTEGKTTTVPTNYRSMSTDAARTIIPVPFPR